MLSENLLQEEKSSIPVNSQTKVPMYSTEDSSHDCCPNCLSGVLALITCPFMSFCGYPKVVNVNESLVVQYWGKLYREINKPGIYCLNPIGIRETRVSTKLESIDLPNVKVADAKGNPILVSGVVRYRVTNAILASLEVEKYSTYILNQSQAAMKQICSQYPYMADDNKPSLKGETKMIQDRMVKTLQNAVSDAGITVFAFELTDLSYAPEIASAMLVKQQAEAKVEARYLIVQGAVDIATKAITDLEGKGLNFSQEEKTRMVSNLLSVICSDNSVHPVIDV